MTGLLALVTDQLTALVTGLFTLLTGLATALFFRIRNKDQQSLPLKRNPNPRRKNVTPRARPCKTERTTLSVSRPAMHHVHASIGLPIILQSLLKPLLQSLLKPLLQSLLKLLPKTTNILIIGEEGCGKTTVKNHLQTQAGQETAVIDTFGIEYDTFFKETKDKVLGHYRNVHLIVFVLKYEEEPDEEAIQDQFDLFNEYFTVEVHRITVLVITHCERKKNKEVIEEYTQLCPTDRARLGIIPVDFIENPSGPWKGRIIKKMKDDEEILHNLVLKCKKSVPASEVFHKTPQAKSSTSKIHQSYAGADLGPT